MSPRIELYEQMLFKVIWTRLIEKMMAKKSHACILLMNKAKNTAIWV